MGSTALRTPLLLVWKMLFESGYPRALHTTRPPLPLPEPKKE